MNIAIFHNIPGGGGFRVMKELHEYLSLRHNVRTFSLEVKGGQIWRNKISNNYGRTIEIKPPNNFLLNLHWTVNKLPQIHKRLAKKINKFDLAIISHDYFTKSPYLLRYLEVDSIYILNEPPREFYEKINLHISNYKGLLAHFMRNPLKYIDKQNVKHAKHIVANSKYTKKKISVIYGRKSKIIYPGVDTSKFKPIENINKKNQILLIGGLKKLKGHDFVLRSIKPILDKYHVVIVGDGKNEYKERLKKTLGNKSKFLKIIEHVSEKKLIRLFNESKVHCIGAYQEPFGMTSIEAQSSGTPVVAVSEGGLPENIDHEKTGYLTRRDEEDFRLKTIKAIQNYRELGKNGVKTAQTKWKWENTLSQINSLINEN